MSTSRSPISAGSSGRWRTTDAPGTCRASRSASSRTGAAPENDACPFSGDPVEDTRHPLTRDRARDLDRRAQLVAEHQHELVAGDEAGEVDVLDLVLRRGEQHALDQRRHAKLAAEDLVGLGGERRAVALLSRQGAVETFQLACAVPGRRDDGDSRRDPDDACMGSILVKRMPMLGSARHLG